jgi:hypothetical protein
MTTDNNNNFDYAFNKNEYNFYEDPKECMNIIFKERKSFVRFGDGEFGQIIYKLNLPFINYNEKIIEKYNYCLFEDNNILIGLPFGFFNHEPNKYTDNEIQFWKRYRKAKYSKLKKLTEKINKNRVILNANAFRLGCFKNRNEKNNALLNFIEYMKEEKNKIVIFLNEGNKNNVYKKYLMSHFDSEIYYVKDFNSDFLEERMKKIMLNYDFNNTTFLGFIGPLWKKIVIDFCMNYDIFCLDLGNCINSLKSAILIEDLEKIKPKGNGKTNENVMEPTKVVLIIYIKKDEDIKFIDNEIEKISNQTNKNFSLIIYLNNENKIKKEEIKNKIYEYSKHNKKINILVENYKKNDEENYRSYIKNVLNTDIKRIVIAKKNIGDKWNNEFINNIYLMLQNKDLNKLIFFNNYNNNCSSLIKSIYLNKYINEFKNYFNRKELNNLYFNTNNNEFKIYYKDNYLKSIKKDFTELNEDILKKLENQIREINDDKTKNFSLVCKPFKDSNFYFSLLPVEDRKLTNFSDHLLNFEKNNEIYYSEIKGINYKILEWKL